MTQLAECSRISCDDGATQAAAFLDHLMTVPLERWCDAGLRASRAATRTSCAALQRAVGEYPDLFFIWCRRDDVYTALYRFECADARTRRTLAAARRVLREATERALLALLLRDTLAAADFDRLYDGFELVWPHQPS
jgi:hypothetical protein